MNALLAYPRTPVTFYSFHNALKFVSKRSAEPPLGLLTIASFFPDTWNVQLVDENVTTLTDATLVWADYVFVSGMQIQKSAFTRIVTRCNQRSIPVVAGGPLISAEHEAFPGVDYMLLNEVERSIPEFLRDLEKGNARRVYGGQDYPPLSLTPPPRWELLDMHAYATMSVQYSRGCPYTCEFCNIHVLNGRKPRLKESGQFLEELQGLYNCGWRGSVFIVDDNFIGNRRKLTSDLLPALIEWSKNHAYPFRFSTEVSINLADDIELTSMMREAGFQHVFVGIESPNNESLVECGKTQNLKRDMILSVKTLQREGLIVSGGFIIGFDNDPPDIFEQQTNFIQRSGITTAMVGLLNVPLGTRLHERLRNEDRLLTTTAGNNLDGSLGFLPKMDYKVLIRGYKQTLIDLYSPRKYFERTLIFLSEYRPAKHFSSRITRTDILALFRSIWKLGLRERGRRYYWQLIFITLFRYPTKVGLAITIAIYGFHFRKVVDQI
jgi:radical SAM superfamily enzyme YgiQ (UPF0313 family)